MGRSNRFFFALFALLSLTIVAAGTAATYTVAPSGGNFTTIQAALNFADQPGDVIQVRAGTYYEKISFPHSGSAGAYITLMAYEGESPIIDGTGVAGRSMVWINSQSYVKIIGFVIREINNGNASFGVRVQGLCSHVEILNNRIHDISGKYAMGVIVAGNQTATELDIIIDNNEIYNLEVNNSSTGFEGSGVRVDSTSGSLIRIRNNHIHNTSGPNAMGITIYGRLTSPISDLIIDHNEINDCEPASSEALVLNGNVTDFEVTYNNVHDVNNIGIDFIGGETEIQPDLAKGARDGVCRGNRVYNARDVGADPSAPGIYIDGGQRIVLENNVVSDCNFGISVGTERLDFVASDDTVRNNIVYNNDKAGLVIGGASPTENGRAMNCYFLNNVFYKNAVLFQAQENGEVNIQYAENNELRNNIFYCNSQNILLAGGPDHIYTTLDYNLWYAEAGINNAHFNWNWTNVNQRYSSFTSYQDSTDQDDNSNFENPQLLNPSLPTNPDFHIAATSWAKDHGDPAFVPGEVELDIDGQDRVSNGRVDIGADEIQQNPTPPAAPSNLAATAANSSTINLSWNDNSTNEAVFKIERKTGAGGTYEQIAEVAANSIIYSNNTGLNPGMNYYYQVRAYNSAGNSPYSNEDDATTTVPPNAPSNLVATAAGSSVINLTWDDPSSNETGFKIERKTGTGGAYLQIAMLNNANAISYSDNTGLSAGTTYFYRVRAFNATDHSDYSNEASATTLANTNLALGKPATAQNSYNNQRGPGKAVDDDDVTTYWRSGTNTKTWLRVDLGSTQSVGSVVVKWRGIYYAKVYKIQTSSNGSTFTTVYTDNFGNGGTDNCPFATVLTRYVRLQITQNNDTDNRVNEFEIYAGALAKEQSAEETASVVPDAVTLAPNFPNPFSANGTFGNPTTHISFSLPNTMHATLKIYNISGQEVATLVNETRERGNYTVTFDASRLTSGVYFSVLQAGEVRQVRRLVLMK